MFASHVHRACSPSIFISGRVRALSARPHFTCSRLARSRGEKLGPFGPGLFLTQWPLHEKPSAEMDWCDSRCDRAEPRRLRQHHHHPECPIGCQALSQRRGGRLDALHDDRHQDRRQFDDGSPGTSRIRADHWIDHAQRRVRRWSVYWRHILAGSIPVDRGVQATAHLRAAAGGTVCAAAGIWSAPSICTAAGLRLPTAARCCAAALAAANGTRRSAASLSFRSPAARSRSQVTSPGCGGAT